MFIDNKIYFATVYLTILYIFILYIMKNKRFSELRKALTKYISNFSVQKVGDMEVIFDGEELFEGIEVNTYDADGKIIPLSDGEYEINGKKVQVTDGKVSAILDKEPSKKVDEPKKTDLSDEEKAFAEKKAELIKFIEESNDAEAIKKSVADFLESLNTKKADEPKKEDEKPLADPIPQKTNMSSAGTNQVPEVVKGTKFERAFKLFNN